MFNLSKIAKVAIVGLVLASSSAMAGVSANVGLVSDYYFRGINLGDAGAYVGADYEQSGFYAGTWIIDDGAAGNDGLETDFYLGYGATVGPVDLTIGYNLYEYTYTPDSEGEIYFSAAAGPVTVEFATGEDMQDGGDFDYDFFSISLANDTFGILYGDYSNDGTDASATSPVLNGSGDYDYFEVSASGEMSGLSMSVSLGAVSNDDVDGDDGYIFLDISKSFDL